MKDGKLSIYYKGRNKQLDDALIEHLHQFGYELWASGFDIKEGVRDLAFETVPTALNSNKNTTGRTQ